MKSEMIFMVAVLGIAGIHLLFSLVNFLAKFKGTPVRETGKAMVRDDWYVFFDRSTLLGKDAESPLKSANQPKNRAGSTPAHEESRISAEVYV